jgi:CheY-like chemotaxis protein
VVVLENMCVYFFKLPYFSTNYFEKRPFILIFVKFHTLCKSIFLNQNNETMNPKLTLAIIEDNPIDVIILRHIISIVASDIEICSTAANIVDAIALIEKHRPEIIISDIQLADGSAFQLLEQLQKKKISIGELIFMSGTIMPSKP